MTSLPQRTLLTISLLLAALVSFTFGYDIWQWHDDWQLTHTMPTIPADDTNKATTHLLADLPKEHLFGQSFTDGNVPISNLQLLVTGINAVENSQDDLTSKAYISIAGQPSKIYAVGDELPDGVKVYAITPNAVILENDGHFEKLPLPRAELQFKPIGEEF